MASMIRLYTVADLAEGGGIVLDADQSRYLTRVMRLTPGDELLLFNGRDGEWRADIEAVEKRHALVAPRVLERPQTAEDGPWLAFAPIKKTGTDFIIQKATELGAGRLMPMTTANTQTSRLNIDRLKANAIEAAEQCRRLTVPVIDEMSDLDNLIAAWPEDRRLFLLDETGGGTPLAAELDSGRETACGGPEIACGFLVGPEGGFSENELKQISAQPNICRITLGPRILRAETACLAALAVWQAVAGDWK